MGYEDNNNNNNEWDTIVVTVFLLILNQMEFHLVQNRKENCHHDYIPFNVKGNRNIVFSVYAVSIRRGFQNSLPANFGALAAFGYKMFGAKLWQGMKAANL